MEATSAFKLFWIDIFFIEDWLPLPRACSYTTIEGSLLAKTKCFPSDLRLTNESKNVYV